MSFGKPIRARIGAPGFPIRRLVNLVAGVDMHVGAFRLVVWVEVNTWAVADAAGIMAVSTVSGVVAAGRNFLERNRIGRE